MSEKERTTVWGTSLKLGLSLILVTALSIGVLIFSKINSAQAQPADLNSAAARYPNIAGTSLQSCDLCHAGSPPNLNAYGADYLANGRTSAALGLIENFDSDGDGFTNIQEIRNYLTFPGNPNSFPSVTATPTLSPPTPTLTSSPTTPPAGTPTATPTGTSIPGGLDLDIHKFKVNKEIELKEAKPINISVDIWNNSMVGGSGVLTVIGMQNGVEVYNFSMVVSDSPGHGGSHYSLPSYMPTAGGDILWTATLTDDNSDMDSRSSVTRVKVENQEEDDENSNSDNGNGNGNENGNNNGNGNENGNGNGNGNNGNHHGHN